MQNLHNNVICRNYFFLCEPGSFQLSSCPNEEMTLKKKKKINTRDLEFPYIFSFTTLFTSIYCVEQDNEDALAVFWA